MEQIQLDRYYDRNSEYPHYEDYKQLLFRAGDALQSSEVNEIQTTLRRDLRFLAERYLRNGEFVSGGNVETFLDETGAIDPNGNPLYDVRVKCSSGLVFANGFFINVTETELLKVDQFLEESDFQIGVQVSWETVCEDLDETLKDPALETSNFKQPGACRLKMTGSWILEEDYQGLDDTEFLPLFRIKRGDIYNNWEEDVEDDFIDTFEKDVTNIVARYDRNANGNYLIEGYEVEFMERVPQLVDDGGTPDDESDDVYEIDQLGPFKFSIADGNANVDGYNYQKDISQEITLEKLIDFELKQSEPINFSSDGWYIARHNPVRKVFRVSGQKRQRRQAVQHGSFIGASDELPDNLQPVIEIEAIWQDENNYSETNPEFIKGTDYVLDGDNVKWLPNGNEPAPNSTYFVTFRYQHTEVEGNFESSDGVNFNGDISDDYASIYLQGFATGTTVNFDYDFVLKRIDTIFIDASGKIGYVKGVPNEDDPRAPETDKQYSLEIAEVLLGGDFDPQVTQSAQRVFKMSDIQLLLDAIRQNEYNITRMALQQNIQDTQPGANLKGQFVDTFKDDTKRDEGLESELTPPDYRALTIGGNLVMNISWETFNLEPLNDLNPDQMSIEMPSIQVSQPVLSQPYVTKWRLINEYLFKSPPSAKISIAPSVYRWVSENHYRTFVNQVQSATRSINSWSTRYKWFGTHRWHSLRGSTITSSSVSREVLGTSVNRTESIQHSRSPAIIPRINIRIRSAVKDFNQGEAVNIYLDNKYATTLHANSSGEIDGWFQVPSNVISGSKEVKAVGAVSGVVGTTLFKAEPLSRTVQTTVTTWWRWVVRRQGILWYEADPVAQSFIVNKTMALDKIRIVFHKLPVTDVTCVVCETSAGFPDKNKALISKTLSPDELNSIGSTQDFIFDNKVILTKGKEYAFIIICKDAVGAVQVAKLGERTWDYPQHWLTGQAYSVGVLYNSSNNSAWTPLQEEDMRFWLYECKFDESYDFVYTDVNVTDATDLMVLANAKVYEGCSIKYKVELLDRADNDPAPNYFLENAYSQVPLETAYTGRIRVTAVFNSNGLFTPVLDPNVQLSVGNSKKKSSYISVGFEFDPDVAKVSVLLDNYRPTNTAIVVSFQVFSDTTNGTYTWQQFTPETSSTPLENEWIESKFIFDWQQFKIDNPSLVDQTYPQKIGRVKIDLYTTNDKDRAVLSNLRLNTLNI